MSKVTTVYDNMITRVSAVLTSHMRLPNPYKPEENAELLLKQGYGVTIGGGSFQERTLGGPIITHREFGVVITRKYYAKENDASAKATTEKQIMEDLFLVVKDFEQDTSLNEVAIKCEFQNDSGVEYVSTNKDQFLMVRGTFEVEYFESLTS